MTPSLAVDREGTVTGNTNDKYGSTNPVVRRLMAAFEGTLDELFTRAASSASTSTTRCCTSSGRAARRPTSSTA